MDTLYQVFLKGIRKAYLSIVGYPANDIKFSYHGADVCSALIYSLMEREQPVMIARFGANELSCIVNYLSINEIKHNILDFIKGKSAEWWWSRDLFHRMQYNAGFFPVTENNLSRYCEMMLDDLQQLDVLGSWLPNEELLNSRLENVIRVPLADIEPSHSDIPWTKVLEHKRILVIHPFSDTIKFQYENNRDKLYKNKNILPEFESIQIIRAVQSIGGINDRFNDWFEALDWMKSEIDKCDFDICLIGCGAYGFPLAAYVKKRGGKAIHWGGSLQLLFGIKGGRWDKDGIYNGFWTRPFASDISPYLNDVEDGCYI